MSLFRRAFTFLFPGSAATSPPPMLQAFILEPILTPSGLVDDSIHTLIIDPTIPSVDNIDISHSINLPASDTQFSVDPGDIASPFDGGYFTVGADGKVSIDFIFDGGGYKGELAIFSLDGMGDYELGSAEFIKEAAHRALSDSTLGHIVISDQIEGGKFTGSLGEPDYGEGQYLGIKTFNMLAGDKFGVMLVPNGHVDQVFANPTIEGDIHPLFSLSTANPNDAFHLGQIADVTGDGNTFVMEDLRVDTGTDRDYNDIIFQIKGAKGTAVLMDDVIDPNHDWRPTDLGKEIVGYVEAQVAHNPPLSTVPHFDDPKINILDDTVKWSIQSSQDLTNYDAKDLAVTQQWVVHITDGYSPQALANSIHADVLGTTGHIANTYVIDFQDNITPVQAAQRLEFLRGSEFYYPLVPLELEPHSVAYSNDPLFSGQWHLDNSNPNQVDINVLPAWNTYNVTGHGTVIGVVDTGLNSSQPDLTSNYRVDLSRDFTEFGGWQTYDSIPDDDHGHGTAVAAVAAGADNTFGGLGVAPGAQLAGLKLLGSGGTQDIQIADALTYKNDDIDVFNNSWGPTTWMAAGVANSIYALSEETIQGRDGLGNVQIFAAGNSGHLGGNVNYNPFANNRNAIAVAAVDNQGDRAFFSTPGAAVLVSAPGYGVVSTNINGDPAILSGTSFAAPQVAGVVALMLEANPTLTNREIQQILVHTATKNDPTDPGWRQNGAGLWVNDNYGFGLVNAEAAVQAARNWSANLWVGTEVKLDQGEYVRSAQGHLNYNQPIARTVNFTEDITVERAEVMVDIKHSNRGDLEVALISPDGTKSILAAPRIDPGDNYDHWVFDTVQNWGESSQGDWKLQVTDKANNSIAGQLISWQLNLYGAKPTINISPAPDGDANGDGIADADANEDVKKARFKVERNPLLDNKENDVVVNYTVSGGGGYYAATQEFDYEPLTGTVTIPAGQNYAYIEVTPIDDNVAEWHEGLSLSVLPTNHYEVGPVSSAAAQLWDNDKPEVYATTYDNYASETGNIGRVNIYRLGDIRDPLTVNYTTDSGLGFADVSSDYDSLLGNVNIAARSHFGFTGAGSIYTNPTDSGIVINPINDSLVEPDELAQIRITSDPSYNIGQATTNVTIWSDDGGPGGLYPTLTITKTADGKEGSPNLSPNSNGEFIIHRQGNISGDLKVNVAISQSATPGADYTTPFALSSVITLPADQEYVHIPINVLNDSLGEGTEHIQIRLQRPDANSDYYVIGPDALEAANVYIIDNEAPTVQWAKELGTSVYDYATAIAIDNDENVYITGRTSGTLDPSNPNQNGIYDAFAAKYDKSGNLLWTRQLGSGTGGNDEATGIAVDNNGNVYITGSTDGTAFPSSGTPANADKDAFLAKYSTNGDLIKVIEYGNYAYDAAGNRTAIGADSANGIAVDKATGDVYITGRTLGNAVNTTEGKADAFVAGFTTSLDFKWSRTAEISSSQFDEGQAVAVDSNGNVYVTGHSKGDVVELDGYDKNSIDEDVWVAKYTSNGTHINTKQIYTPSTTTQADDEARSITVDNGNVYIGGKTNGQFYGGLAGGSDAFVAKLDDTLDNVLWTRQYGSGSLDYATGVTTDTDGMVYLSGRSQNGSMNGWLAMWDQNGNAQWSRSLGVGSDDATNGVAVGQDDIYVAGYTGSAFNVDGQNPTYYGGDDAFVASLQKTWD